MTRPAIHPGEILADELTELGMTPAALAREIAVPPNRISQIIRGRRNISGDTALRLGHWFGTSAQFWLNLQSSYEIRLAQEKAGDEIASRMRAGQSFTRRRQPGEGRLDRSLARRPRRRLRARPCRPTMRA